MAEGIRIFLLLVDFRQEVPGEGPVFLHDTGRGFHAAGLELVDRNREAVGFAGDADGVVSVLDPILIGQVNGVLLGQRVDILGINHGDGVWILGSVLSGEVSGNGVVGVVDLDVYALLLGVFLGHVLHLAFNLDLGVEDSDLGSAGA